MPIGDSYKCKKCGHITKAANTLDTQQCKNINCLHNEVEMVIPEENGIPIMLPADIDDPAYTPSLIDIKKAEGVPVSKIDEALHKLEFRETETERINRPRKEEKKMAEKDADKGWSGTAPTEYDPENDLRIILKDIGVKNKIQTIVKMFFQGDTDSPKWLDECLRMANLDVPRRRLTIAGYFGHVPPELGLGTSDDESNDVAEPKKVKPGIDPLKAAQDQIRAKKAAKLLEMEADMEISDMEAKMEKKIAAKDAKPIEPDKQIVRIPATDDNGNPMKDEKGAPIILEIPRADLPFYFMNKNSSKPKESTQDEFLKSLMLKQQEQLNALQNMYLAKAAESNKPDEKAMAEKKYWEEKAERERKERDEAMTRYQKERDEFMKQMYEMREGMLKKDMTELVETVKALNVPFEQKLMELKGKADTAVSLGLIKTGVDPKTQVQTEIAHSVSAEVTSAMKELRGGINQAVNEGIAMAKEERQRQMTGSTAPPGIGVAPSEKDKDDIYKKLQAKMEEENQKIIQERSRIEEARAALEKRNSELMAQWEKMGKQDAPKVEPPKVEPPVEQPIRLKVGIGMAPPDTPKPVEPVSPPSTSARITPVTPTTTGTPMPPSEVVVSSSTPESAVDKKLKELEAKSDASK